MRRFRALLLAALLLLTLTGCARAAGGSYRLDYITANGLRMPPGGFGLHVSFNLEEDGVGTGSFGGDVVDITWTDEGSTVVVEGPRGTLEFTKDGKSLVLQSPGTLMFFNPVEEDD